MFQHIPNVTWKCFAICFLQVILTAPSFTSSQRESSVTVLDGVDVTQTNMSFFRHQLTRIATHILRCTGKGLFFFSFTWMFRFHYCLHLRCGDCSTEDNHVLVVHREEIGYWNKQFSIPFPNYEGFSNPDETFGPRLLQMCNQALFECLALNLHCLRGDQRALTAVINHRIVSSPWFTT